MSGCTEQVANAECSKIICISIEGGTKKSSDQNNLRSKTKAKSNSGNPKIQTEKHKEQNYKEKKALNITGGNVETPEK